MSERKVLLGAMERRRQVRKILALRATAMMLRLTLICRRGKVGIQLHFGVDVLKVTWGQ